MQPIQIPLKPKPGEIWFFIDLNLVSSHQLGGLFALLTTLGFTPQMAYRQVGADLEICVLLYHGTLPGMTEPPHQLYEQEQYTLANVLEDPNAMHFCCGLVRKPTAIAA
jgi:hypothetical protein